MARRIRIYDKKRGHRRSGSAKAGSAGEAIFFTVFFLLGCGGLAGLIGTFVIPEWRATHEFVPHRCAVLDMRVGHIQREGRPFYRPEIQVKYDIEGETYVVWTYDVHNVRGNGYSPDKLDAQRVLRQFQAGHEYRCWYDPSDRTAAVLVRGLEWWVWVTFAVPVSLILIGGGGLIYRLVSWGKSDERRSALVRKAASLAPFEPAGGGLDFPNVPNMYDIINSPGTTLRYRLPMTASPFWALAATLAACLFWNGIVGLFVVFAINGHVSGAPDWFLTVFLVPFALVGVGLIYYFVRQLLVTTGIGPTMVEVSDHPLRPGERYQIFLSQTGRLRVNSMEILLVCEEEATFRHGTDTRTETRRVFEQPLFRREGFEVHRGMPFENLCDFEIPPGAMHSFKSPHNEVNWNVLVRGDVANWPNYERSFPIIVYPGEGGKSR
ncbi:MAG: DUF3592 domain-containing protein [Rhodopirellula sp.]|nr:DUF3592 domain-containing protein [Rhodopirellula sp.]